MAMAFFGEMIIIPPLVEESMKFLTLTHSFHFAIVFTLVFAILEFIHYLFMFGTAEEFVLIRFICMVSHFTYLLIQIIGFKLYYKTGWKGYVIISLISAWILHVAWNGILGQLTFSLILNIM